MLSRRFIPRSSPVLHYIQVTGVIGVLGTTCDECTKSVSSLDYKYKAIWHWAFRSGYASLVNITFLLLILFFGPASTLASVRIIEVNNILSQPVCMGDLSSMDCIGHDAWA